MPGCQLEPRLVLLLGEFIVATTSALQPRDCAFEFYSRFYLSQRRISMKHPNSIRDTATPATTKYHIKKKTRGNDELSERVFI